MFLADTSTSTTSPPSDFDLHLVLQQFGAHAFRPGVGLVDLVDRHDHRNLRRLGVVDRFHRLRHHAVIGRDYQHHDVGHLGAARAHRGKRGMTRRVDEGDLLAAFRRGHLIGADMLGDPAGFAGDDIGVAQRVEQRGLAVVDVTHHGHHRRARLGIGGIVDDVKQAFLDVRCRDALDAVTHFFGDELGGIGVDHVGDLVHRALLHQQPDDVDRALGHAIGEFLDIDGLGDDHFANQLFFRLVRLMPLQALGAAPERGDRALAHVIGIEGGNQRQASALLLRRRLGGGFRCSGGTQSASGASANLTGTFILLDLDGDARRSAGRDCRAGRCRRRASGLGLAKALLGFEFGLALGFLILPMALFFSLAAGFGRFTLGLLDALAAGAALGLFLRDLALFDVADLCVGECAGARRALVFGQRSQHDPGSIARLSRRAGRGTHERRFRGRGLGNDRLGRVGFRRSRFARQPALAALFDHHLLGPAVAEALAHGARLNARLERQGLARDTQRLVARRFPIHHSAVLIFVSVVRRRTVD